MFEVSSWLVNVTLEFTAVAPCLLLSDPSMGQTASSVDPSSRIMDGFRRPPLARKWEARDRVGYQLRDSLMACESIGLGGLVEIGSEHANTHGAALAEYFKANGCLTKVAGCAQDDRW